MKSGQFSSQKKNTYCLEDSLGLCYPGRVSSPREETSLILWPCFIKLKARVLWKALLIMKRKIRFSSQSAIAAGVPGATTSRDRLTEEPGRKQDMVPTPSLSTEEYSFPGLETKQKEEWRIQEEGSALLSGSTSPDPTCS